MVALGGVRSCSVRRCHPHAVGKLDMSRDVISVLIRVICGQHPHSLSLYIHASKAS
jgi:hypothetical protein